MREPPRVYIAIITYFEYNPHSMDIYMLFGSLFIEAAAVGVVCAVFLILMVVAGIRQIMKDKEQ